MWRIWWGPNNACKWQMVFNSAFKGQSLCLYKYLALQKHMLLFLIIKSRTTNPAVSFNLFSFPFLPLLVFLFFLILYFYFYFFMPLHSRENSYYLCHVRLSVGPSFRLSACYQRASAGRIFLGIWYLVFLWKYVMKIHIWLKSSKNMGHFTWRPKYVFFFVSGVIKSP